MNVRNLRANLAAVLDRAAVGETVEITRDGVPVAVVAPRSVGVNELGDSRVPARPGSPPVPARPWWRFTEPFTVGDGEEWRASLDFGGVEYRLRGRPRSPGEIGPSLRDVLDVLAGAGAMVDEAHAGDLVTEVYRRALAGGVA